MPSIEFQSRSHPNIDRFGFHIRGSTESPAGGLNFWVSGSSSNTAASAGVSYNFADSTWHHLVGVIDRSSGQFFTYAVHCTAASVRVCAVRHGSCGLRVECTPGTRFAIVVASPGKPSQALIWQDQGWGNPAKP
jgi:hypothetical protein